ncbi:hypothetical protein GCM10027341_18810 [Spirosoma knui]
MSFLNGGGEMGELTRHYDWSATALGGFEEWSQSLRTVISMMLRSRFPMVVFWGADLITFYNDAFRPSLGSNGKHPSSLGQPGHQSWAESWPVIGPMINSILAGGEAVWFEDQKLPIYRDGQMGYAYWTYSFSSLTDDKGAIQGVLVTCTETTQAVESQKQLAESNEELAFAIEATELGTWDLNPSSGKFRANARLKEWFGLKPDDEVLLSQAMNVIAAEDQQRVAALIEQALDYASGGRYDTEYTIIHPHTRQPRRVRAKGRAWFTEEQRAYRFNGTLQDITQRSLAEKTVRQSEARFRSLVEEAPVATGLFVGRELRIELANEVMIDLWGKGPSVVGKPLAEALPELADQPFFDILDQVFTTGEAYSAQGMRADLVVDGVLDTYYFDFTYKPLRNEDGEVYAILDMAVDVTGQVKAHQQLEESEWFSRSIIDHSPIAKVVFVGEDMVIERINLNMLHILGRDASIMGKPFMEAIPELLDTPLMDRLRHVLSTGETFTQPEEKFNLVRFGEPYTGYFQYIYKALSNPAGERYGVIVTASEVTAQVVARQQLEEAQANLQGAIELAQLGTWELDVATGQFHYSDTIKAWLGYDQLSVDYSQLLTPIHPDDQQTVIAAIQEALRPGSEGIYDAEYRLVAYVTGEERVVHARGKVLINEEEEVYKLVGTAQDVTHQRQLQRELERQVQERTQELAVINEELMSANEEYAAINEELAATLEELSESNELLQRSNENLQRFAYVASHDLQEPLRKIQSFGDLLKKRHSDVVDENIDYLERMQSAASRMSTLIKDLLNYSRISTQQESRELVSLEQIVRMVLGDLDLIIEETGAQVVVESLPTVMGDSLQLGQLFQNLLSNALKFRREGVPPLIEVSAKQLTAEDLPVGIKPFRKASRYHLIEVADNGIGFHEKYLDRMFEVFQRLHGRSAYEGTGIGLAICEKVVTNHGGAITASSQPGQGATFRVYLPA